MKTVPGLCFSSTPSFSIIASVNFKIHDRKPWNTSTLCSHNPDTSSPTTAARHDTNKITPDLKHCKYSEYPFSTYNPPITAFLHILSFLPFLLTKLTLNPLQLNLSINSLLMSLYCPFWLQGSSHVSSGQTPTTLTIFSYLYQEHCLRKPGATLPPWLVHASSTVLEIPTIIPWSPHGNTLTALT